jgi:hypothetical protein
MYGCCIVKAYLKYGYSMVKAYLMYGERLFNIYQIYGISRVALANSSND